MGTFRRRSISQEWRAREPTLDDAIQSVLKAQMRLLEEAREANGAVRKRAGKPRAEMKCSLSVRVRVENSPVRHRRAHVLGLDPRMTRPGTSENARSP